FPIGHSVFRLSNRQGNFFRLSKTQRSKRSKHAFFKNGLNCLCRHGALLELSYPAPPRWSRAWLAVLPVGRQRFEWSDFTMTGDSLEHGGVPLGKKYLPLLDSISTESPRPGLTLALDC